MKPSRTKSTVVLALTALAGIVALGRASLLQQGTTEPLFPPSEIPWCLRTSQGGTVRHAFQVGHFSLNAMERSVRILWSASGTANQPPNYNLTPNFTTGALGPYVVAQEEQDFVTRYYPTASGSTTKGTALIGGITASGGTILEEWSFDWPSAMPQPTTDPSTGLIHVNVAIPSVTKHVVFSSPPTATHRFVAGVCGLRKHVGQTTHALLQFYAPNDIVIVSLADGSTTTLASQSGATGTLGAVAALGAKDYSAITASERQNGGYAYLFSRGRTDLPVQADTWDVPTLLLLDNTMDGTPDIALQLSTNDWHSQGWDNLENYVEPWLD